MKTVIQKEDVLEKAIRTRYFFDIQSILDAMQKDGLIKPDGTLYSLFLHSPVYADDLSALNAALTSALEQRPSLSAQISHAAQRTAAQSAEPTFTPNMER